MNTEVAKSEKSNTQNAEQQLNDLRGFIDNLCSRIDYLEGEVNRLHLALGTTPLPRKETVPSCYVPLM